ncbi:MAG: hypothetical protein ACOY90_15090 [Candidatus Zhuqueibacterota bacterium]
MKMIQALCGIVLLAAVMLLQAGRAVSQTNDEIFIYGKITTTDNKTYIGPIRWGEEEVYWTDIFNSSKTENDYVDFLSRQDRKKLDEKSGKVEIFGLKVASWTNSGSHSHTFACQFGDIQSIEMRGRDRVNLQVRNGEVFRLDGGSNDIGATVNILDSDMGLVELDWDMIDNVQFQSTPGALPKKFGEPLFGTVTTHDREFTGLVQWDQDERLGEDELDGETMDGDVSILFKQIAAIEKRGNSCRVKLHSGKELLVSGSNDVDRGNRGVIVTMPGVAVVTIDWRDFRSVRFESATAIINQAYGDFGSPRKLEGTIVTTDGTKYSGALVYDLDEAWDLEMLQGDEDDMEYIIPFRSIKKITPRNFRSSLVELRNGHQLKLQATQDVNEDNDGLLIFNASEKPIWIAWEKVDYVEFE